MWIKGENISAWAASWILTLRNKTFLTRIFFFLLTKPFKFFVKNKSRLNRGLQVIPEQKIFRLPSLSRLSNVLCFHPLFSLLFNYSWMVHNLLYTWLCMTCCPRVPLFCFSIPWWMFESSVEALVVKNAQYSCQKCEMCPC